ncbi:MAG: M24 family metallopeptidase [Oscillospiraceae bacterium]
MNTRLQILAGQLPPGIDCALLQSGPHHRYYLDFTCSYGILLLAREDALFLTDARYIEVARETIRGCEVALQEDTPAQVRAFLARNGAEAVALDPGSATLGTVDWARELTGREPVASEALGELLRSQRMEKDSEELSRISRAHSIAATVLEQIHGALHPGMTETEIQRELGILAAQAGSQLASFDFPVRRDGGHPLLTSQEPLTEEDILALQVRAAWRGYQVELVQSLSLGDNPDCGADKPLAGGNTPGFAAEHGGSGGMTLEQLRAERVALLQGQLEPRTAFLLTGSQSMAYYFGGAEGKMALITADGTAVIGPAHSGDSLTVLARAAAEQHLRILEVEHDQISLSICEALRRLLPCDLVVDGGLDAAIRAQMARKSPEEIGWIQEAQDITDRVFQACIGEIRAGMTDWDIQLLVGVLFHDFGSQALSFDHVMGVGTATSHPHVRPSGRVLERGDLIMLDIGATVNGCGSDMTRMLALGEPDSEKREVYEIVRAAQAAGLAAAKAGVSCCQVDKAARAVIEAAGYGPCFCHGLGHSIGVGPRFTKYDDTPLAPGMVMTVEPGIYLPGRFGIRLEDMIHIREHDTVNMTHSTHELIVL